MESFKTTQIYYTHEPPCTYYPASTIINHFSIFVLSFPFYNLHMLLSKQKVTSHVNLVASDVRVNKGQVHTLKTISVHPNKNIPLLVNKENSNPWLALSKGRHVAGPLISFVVLGRYSTSQSLGCLLRKRRNQDCYEA